jgi:hypothetical protein
MYYTGLSFELIIDVNVQFHSIKNYYYYLTSVPLFQFHYCTHVLVIFAFR